MAADLIKRTTPPLPRRRPGAAGGRPDRVRSDEAAFCRRDGRPPGDSDDDDRRVVDDVRRRAVAGDAASRVLIFRSARGFARPVDRAPAPEAVGPLQPEVAAAMLEAGLLALGLAPADLDGPETW